MIAEAKIVTQYLNISLMLRIRTLRARVLGEFRVNVVRLKVLRLKLVRLKLVRRAESQDET